MKTIIKNKRSYRTKIGRLGTSIYDHDNQDPGPTHGSGSKQAGGSASSIDEASDGPNNSKGDHDSIQGESSTEEDGSGAGSAGTKRKATGSGGSGGKGKQKKV